MLRSSAVQSRFQAFHPVDLSPLVGRVAEIETLLRQWTLAKNGQGQVVILSGEPGIGKSRLVSALQERIASEQHVSVHYSCSPYHTDSALHPVISQIERAAQFQSEDTPEAKLDKLKAVLGPDCSSEGISAMADLLSIHTPVSAPISLSPERKRARIFEVLIEHLGRLTRQDPVLLVYEDVHWIDPTSRELIDLTIKRIQHLAVLMLVTCRPEFKPPEFDQPNFTPLTLDPLGQSDGTALVDRISNHMLPKDVVKAIVNRSDGVPLFIEELTAAVLEAETNASGSRGAGPAAPISTELLPETLHASLLARLDRLDPLAKHVAQVASAIGREFSYELLSAVTRRPEAALGEGLDQLVSSGLIQIHELPPHARYAFKHALVQDAAYGCLLRSVRRELHARIANALEETSGQAATDDPAVLAHHYAQAGISGKAVGYYLEASRKAIARSAMAEAEAQSRKGLEWLHKLPDGADRRRLEFELQLALGRSLIAVAGESAPATGAAFARAEELWQEGDGATRRLSVLQGQFVFRFGRGDLLAARSLAEQCLDLGTHCNDRTARAIGHQYLGICASYLGHLVLGRAHLEQALALGDPEKPEALVLVDHAHVWCRSHLSATLLFLGYPIRALSCSRQALADAEALANPEDVACALAFDAGNYRDVRSPALARERAAALIALATERGFPHWLAEGILFRGWTLAEGGAVDEAIEHMSRGIAILRTGENRIGMQYWLLMSAEVHGRAGRAAAGLALLEEALEAAQGNSARWCEAEVHRLRGDLLRRTANPDATQIAGCFQKAIEVAREQDAKWWELRAATSLAELWRHQGKRGEACELLAPIYDWFAEGFDTADLKDARALLDHLK